MAIIKEIHNKIISIQNTQKITKTMEMVAASKIRKIQERMVSSYHYSELIYKIISNLVNTRLEDKHPYLCERKKISCVGYLVITTDRGLVGGFNINLFKKLLIDIEKWNKQGVETTLALIGSKGVSFFNSTKMKILVKITGMRNNIKSFELLKLIKILLQAYEEEQLDKIYIVNNQFINKLTQVPYIMQILPLMFIKRESLKDICLNYIYESNPQILLNTLLHRYIESKVYQSVIENLAGEQASRMVAMKAATDNGNNLIRELKFIYNKARQNNITQELTEIISGTNKI